MRCDAKWGSPATLMPSASRFGVLAWRPTALHASLLMIELAGRKGMILRTDDPARWHKGRARARMIQLAGHKRRFYPPNETALSKTSDLRSARHAIYSRAVQCVPEHPSKGTLMILDRPIRSLRAQRSEVERPLSPGLTLGLTGNAVRESRSAV